MILSPRFRSREPGLSSARVRYNRDTVLCGADTLVRLVLTLIFSTTARDNVKVKSRRTRVSAPAHTGTFSNFYAAYFGSPRFLVDSLRRLRS